MVMGKKFIWYANECDTSLEKRLSEELGITPIIARLLINRSITKTPAAKRFLSPSLNDLHPAEMMKGMPEALARLEKALQTSEKIIIYGDYDVDGITATVLLYEALSSLGGEVHFFLPNRFADGYGLSVQQLERFKQEGFSLVVTVDCGINAVFELQQAQKLGLDVIVTDHHEPLNSEGELPACAVLNPKQKGCLYPWKELSGVGVVYKLVTALLQSRDQVLEPGKYLDLVALGTVADLVPLLDENRVLVRFGMEMLEKSKRPGLQYLKEFSGLSSNKLSTTDISFGLAPRLNAVGRLGEAEPAAELLLTNDVEKAKWLAQKLHEENEERRILEREIFDEARKIVEADRAAPGEFVIVLGKKGWHPGVLGIVASRLVQHFSRPVVMLTIEEAVARGSARSIPGYHITSALEQCASLLERFGGHKQAAGLTLPADNILPLREKLNEQARELLTEKDFWPRLNIEGLLSGDDLSEHLLEQLRALEPFGTANPEPVFASEDWQIISWRLVGKDNEHLKLKVKQGNRILEPIYFSGQEIVPRLCRYRRLRLAFKIKENSWQNSSFLDLELKDLEFCDLLSSDDLSIIDQRGKNVRFDYLQALIKKTNNPVLEKTNNPVLVFINTLQQIDILKNRLNKDERLVFAHQGKLDAEAHRLAPFKELVLYDLPLQEESLKEFLASSLLADEVRIHLLFGEEEFKTNEKLLQAALPQERSLRFAYEQIYNLWRQGFKVKNIFPRIQKQSPFPVTAYLWQKMISIFTEIKLLGEVKGELIPAREEVNISSKELAASRSYIKASETLEKCREYQHFLLTADHEEVLKHIACMKGRD
ncbi:MAG: single-stranded-DNA-specific exonuclease RecJ [Dethiobacteria bacterium]|jgi:single-stranded-DNA-specific exonuclease